MSAPAEKFLRHMWMRVMLRGIHYGDRHTRLDQFYRLEDPWDMNSEAERFRFDTTNRLILNHFGRSKKLLEIGCGEGHQSEKLANICDNLFGIDVSRRAVERAARRCARGRFAVGDVFSVPFLQSEEPFDLAVACELLYYVKDIRAVVTQMQRLGRSCFVTYLGLHHGMLAPFLDELPGQQSEEFSYDDTHWRAVWWPSRQPQFGR